MLSDAFRIYKGVANELEEQFHYGNNENDCEYLPGQPIFFLGLFSSQFLPAVHVYDS